MSEFDLTNPSGLTAAAAWQGSIGSGVASYAKYIATGGVPGLAIRALLGLTQKALSSDEALVKQAKAAEDLIASGQAKGVKKMTVIIDQKAGLHFEVPVEGANVELSAGSKGKIRLDVEYK